VHQFRACDVLYLTVAQRRQDRTIDVAVRQLGPLVLADNLSLILLDQGLDRGAAAALAGPFRSN